VRAGAAARLAVVLSGLAAAPVHATLGEPAASIDADTARLGRASRVLAASPTPTVRQHVITLADGSVIREYVGANGLVFAVSWNTRFKPRLDALLGQYAPTYAAAASQAALAPGIRHSVAFAQGDLVVDATAHLNAHAGLAWLRSLVPAGVRIDDLR